MAPIAAQARDRLAEGRRSVSVGEPTPPVSANGKLFSVVPSQMLTTSKDGRARIYTKSYMLAISTDEGTSWKFLDGTGLSKENREKVAPDLPATFSLPRVEGPIIKGIR